MKPLLLGECPSRTRDEFYESPLLGNSGKLCELAGLRPFVAKGTNIYIDPRHAPYAALCHYYDVHNLFERYQPRWSKLAAKRAWKALEVPRGTVVVALGRRVASAIGAPVYWGLFWTDEDGRELTAIPHPSGKNRLYNQGWYRDVAYATLTEARERANRNSLG
jgi:hypothetical protein